MAQMPVLPGLAKFKTGHPPAYSGFKTLASITTAQLGPLFFKYKYKVKKSQK
jgi:hypothetical protein